MKAEDWKKKLELTPHPEGGYFREVYRSNDFIKHEGLPERYKSSRVFGTSIYFLLEGNQFSTFHKLESDETWHFYDGCSITIHMINYNGDYSFVRLGKSEDENEVLQFTIPRNTWFAAAPEKSESFSLVGCSVYPGFDFEDFEMGNQKELTELFPQHQSLIKKFTKG